MVKNRKKESSLQLWTVEEKLLLLKYSKSELSEFVARFRYCHYHYPSLYFHRSVLTLEHYTCVLRIVTKHKNWVSIILNNTDRQAAKILEVQLKYARFCKALAESIYPGSESEKLDKELCCYD